MGLTKSIFAQGASTNAESHWQYRAHTPIDLESIPVDHLGILAWNNIGFRIVKGFEFGKTRSFAKLGHEIWDLVLIAAGSRRI